MQPPPTLANSGIRTFTLLDSKNALIFSSVSLSSEFSSQVSAIPVTISTLGASFELNIETWRTDERSCAFVRFPMVAEQSPGDFQTYPIYAFCTAESSMTFQELQQRTILYFRVCQALLQPTEFRPPWSFHMQTLSITPTYLISVLSTAERMCDRNPALLHHCFVQYPPVSIKQLESDKNSPARLIKRLVENIQTTIDGLAVSLVQEVLTKLQIVVFVDDQVFGVFSASSVNNGNVTATKIDSIDAIVLTVLQADEQFMHGVHFDYALREETSDALLSKMKKIITNQSEEDCAVETVASIEQMGRRIVQTRIANKLTSVVAVFKKIDLEVDLPDGYPKPKCNICYIHPITAKLAGICTSNCNGKLPVLIDFCMELTDAHLKPFEKFIANDTQLYVINSHNPERSFSIRYQISSHPGLLYFSIKNLSRGAILAPNLEVDSDIQSILQAENKVDEQTDHQQYNETEPPFIKTKQVQQKLYNEPEIHQQQQSCPSVLMNVSPNLDNAEYIKQIQKQFKIARIQVAKLLQMEHEALAQGITYSIERDVQFCRVLWVFFYNVTPTTEVPKQPIAISPLQGLWQVDCNTFPCPLSRQQITQLNQCEEVMKGKRTEYTEQGGYVGTPQYWASLEQKCKESKNYKKFMQQFPANQPYCFEMFEVQGVFLSLVSLDDIKQMTLDLFRKFASLVWGDYYGTK